MPRKPPENRGPEGPKGTGKWVKGGPSPNPGGRPKATRELLDGFRLATPRAREVAERIMDNEGLDPKLRLDAAKFIASYGLGKPPSVEMGDEAGIDARPLVGLTHAQLMEIVDGKGEGH